MEKNKKFLFDFDYYILMFFLTSVIGWVWEVALYLIRERRFVNRGILSGPYLPVYGAGTVLLYLVLKRLEKKPLQVFAVSLALCSFVEYFSGFILEKMWGVRWWDYSGMFLNLHGRICFMSCLFFGIGGLFLIFFLIPIYTVLYKRIPVKVRRTIAIVLCLIFVADAAHSADFPNAGGGITYKIAAVFEMSGTFCASYLS